MTEPEWLAASDPRPMLVFLAGRVSDRKLRLFAFRCWDEQFGGNRSSHTEAAEEYAEGRLDGAAFASRLRWDRPENVWLNDAVRVASRASSLAAGDVYSSLSEQSRALRCAWLRDMFGNPFRPVAIEPAWLTPTVVALARGIDADSAPDRLPILADALQEAGCEIESTLQPLRAERRRESRYVRGDLTLDLLLGRGGWRASVGEPTLSEEEWSASVDPWTMLDFVKTSAPLGRLRHFACACCRRMSGLSSAGRAAVDREEAFARGEIDVATWAAGRAAGLATAAQEIQSENARFAEWQAEHDRRWAATQNSTNQFYMGVSRLEEQCRRDAQVHEARAVIALLNDDLAAVAAEAVDAVVSRDDAQCWEDMVQTDSLSVAADERSRQAALLRDVIGSPFGSSGP